jgi:hypothetical protein
VNQNDGSFRGTKQLWRAGHRRMSKPMRGEGADRAPAGLVRSIRAIAGTSGPSGIVVIANRGAGCFISSVSGTDRAMTDPEQGGNRRGAIAGLAIAVAILALGLWLAHDLTAASKMQDCLMSGRTNCNVIPAP